MTRPNIDGRGFNLGMPLVFLTIVSIMLLFFAGLRASALGEPLVISLPVLILVLSVWTVGLAVPYAYSSYYKCSSCETTFLFPKRKIPLAEEFVEKKCRKCGSILPIDAKFCGKCGAKLK